MFFEVDFVLISNRFFSFFDFVFINLIYRYDNLIRFNILFLFFLYILDDLRSAIVIWLEQNRILSMRFIVNRLLLTLNMDFGGRRRMIDCPPQLVVISGSASHFIRNVIIYLCELALALDVHRLLLELRRYFAVHCLNFVVGSS